jgi:threonine dehydrogenase-like Zn-dependent dehydrogenase
MNDDERGTLAYLAAPNQIELKEYPVPAPEPGAVLADVVRANVCGSELHIWSGDHPLIRDGVLGHEALCRVTALGDGVETDYAGTPVQEGDLVIPAYFATCGRCAHCGAGRFRLCENAYEYWSRPPDREPHFHGTFGTHYYIHPDQYFYRVPGDIDESVAASANCALAQVLCGFDAVGLSVDETVVVQGAGGLGLNAVAVAQEAGAEVIVIDGVRERLEIAADFGAEHLIDITDVDTVADRVAEVESLTDGLGADVAVEVTGVPDAFTEGIELLRDGGRYLEMGNIIPGEETTFEPGVMTRKSITVESLMRYDPWYLQRALSFLSNNGDAYPFDEMLDAEFPLEEVETALEWSRDRSVTRASLIP